MYATEDSRVVGLRVTAALGFALVYITQLPFERLVALPDGMKVVLLIGLGLMVVSAGLFFAYATQAHNARLELAKMMLSDEPLDPDWWMKDVKGPWQSRGQYFTLGHVTAFAGVVLLGWVLGHMLLADVFPS